MFCALGGAAMQDVTTSPCNSDGPLHFLPPAPPPLMVQLSLGRRRAGEDGEAGCHKSSWLTTHSACSHNPSVQPVQHPMLPVRLTASGGHAQMNIDSKPRALAYSRYLYTDRATGRPQGQVYAVHSGSTAARFAAAAAIGRRRWAQPIGAANALAPPLLQHPHNRGASVQVSARPIPHSPQQHLMIDQGAQRVAAPRRRHALGLEILDRIQVGEVDCRQAGGRAGRQAWRQGLRGGRVEQGEEGSCNALERTDVHPPGRPRRT